MVVMEVSGFGSMSRAERMMSGLTTEGRPPTAAGAGRSRALVGADHGDFSDELGQSGEHETCRRGWWCPASRAAR